MAEKTLKELEKELAQALAKITALEADKVKLNGEITARDKTILDLKADHLKVTADLKEATGLVTSHAQRIGDLEGALQRGSGEIKRLNSDLQTLTSAQFLPLAPAGEHEAEIRRRMRGGLTREQAEQCHAMQMEHDANLKEAEAE